MGMLKRVGDPEGQYIDLDQLESYIGRAPECQVVLGPNGVSRKHAVIRNKNNKYFVSDCESRNKTKLNNDFLTPWVEYPLSQDDRINICDIEFVFLEHLPSPASTAPRDENVVTITADSVMDSNLHMLDAASQSSSILRTTVRPEAKLQAIYDITRNLGSDLNMDSVAPKVLDSLFNVFPQAERAFLVLKDEDSEKLIRKAFKYRQSQRLRPLFPAYRQEEPPMTLSQTIVRQVLQQKQAVLGHDAGNLPTSDSIAEMKIQSIMCVPILTPDNRALGIIQMDTSDRKQFTQDDLDLLLAVASQAAVSIDNARMHSKQLKAQILNKQLELAAQVQKTFLPRGLPKADGYEFYAHYDATYLVGGDFYDFISLSNDRLAVAVGDVAGKGMAAALIMAKFSGENRYLIYSEPNLSTAFYKLNEEFNDSGIEEKFITLSVSLIDFKTNTLTFCSAGHMPLMIKRAANGQVEEMGDEATSLAIGVDSGTQFREMEVPLHKGDVVVLYSDGVTDARNGMGDMFDTGSNRRLIKRVRELSGGPQAIGKGLMQSIREFSANQDQADDITLICFGPV